MRVIWRSYGVAFTARSSGSAKQGATARVTEAKRKSAFLEMEKLIGFIVAIITGSNGRATLVPGRLRALRILSAGLIGPVSRRPQFDPRLLRSKPLHSRKKPAMSFELLMPIVPAVEAMRFLKAGG